jgi:chorismate mutase
MSIEISKFNISSLGDHHMLKIIFIIAIIGITGISTNYVYSQEIGLATFQESAQIIIDKKINHESITSITLSSSNIQEIIIPMELEQKIRESQRIQAVVITNQNNCVLGVYDQSCIIINIERNPEDKGIFAIQDSSKEIADLYIDEVNQIFDTNAKFFQVYIHTNDDVNQILDTSGIISGGGTISAVYTMPMEDTGLMYGKLSSMLLSKSIKDGGGFYDTAKILSMKQNAKMSFSITPLESKSLLQLRISAYSPITSQMEGVTPKISPLEFFNIENLNRSNYFSSGNYPLNSIFQIVIISNDETNVSDVNGTIIPTQNIDGIEMPIEVTKKGWIFDPQKGETIQGKFIFGENISINENEMKFSLGGSSLQSKELDESIVMITIIVVISIGAAIFYLKGYKK